MNKLVGILGIVTFAFYSCGGASETEDTTESDTLVVATVDSTDTEEPSGKIILSPRKQAEGIVREVTVKVDYGAPSVRERKIWGGLEEFGEVWRAGANETTAVTFSADTKVNGEAIPAGTYGFFIIPMEEGPWTVIFNEEWSVEEHDAWGASHYKSKKDILRTEIEPQWSDELQEQLMYEVTDEGIQFAWEYARLNIKVG